MILEFQFHPQLLATVVHLFLRGGGVSIHALVTPPVVVSFWMLPGIGLVMGGGEGAKIFCCPSLGLDLGKPMPGHWGIEFLNDPHLSSHDSKSLLAMCRSGFLDLPPLVGIFNNICVNSRPRTVSCFSNRVKMFCSLGVRSLGRALCPSPGISLLSSGWNLWKRSCTWVQIPLVSVSQEFCPTMRAHIHIFLKPSYSFV